MQENHYYPFGMAMTMSSTLAAAPPNNYLYNGKELQPETGWLDYGARMYDASVGRWNGNDPLSEWTPTNTGYHYCHNNPLAFIDPTGMVAGWYQTSDNSVPLFDPEVHSQEDLDKKGIDGVYVGEEVSVELNYADGSQVKWEGGEDGMITYTAEEVNIEAQKSNPYNGNLFVDLGNSYSFSLIGSGISGSVDKYNGFLLNNSKYGTQNHYNFTKPFAPIEKGGYVKRTGSIKVPLGPVHTRVPAKVLVQVRSVAAVSTQVLGMVAVTAYGSKLVLDDEYRGSVDSYIDGAILAIGFIPGGGWLVAGGLTLVKVGLEATGNDFWKD